MSDGPPPLQRILRPILAGLQAASSEQLAQVRVLLIERAGGLARITCLDGEGHRVSGGRVEPADLDGQLAAVAAAGIFGSMRGTVTWGAGEVGWRVEVTPVADDAIAPTELVRMPVGRTASCVICATPTNTVWGQTPVHGGGCLPIYLETLAAPDVDPSVAAEADPAPRPAEPARDEPAVTDRDNQPPPDVGTPKRPVHAPSPRRSSAKSVGRRVYGNDRGRWSAPAAAVDEQLHLADGRALPWVPGHLGELAMLVAEHRLGWGGGKALPHAGELWIYPAALERLGLPVDVDRPDLGTRQERAATRAEIFTPLNQAPAVAAALAAGWEIGSAGRLDARTRIRHEQHLPGGAILDVPTWGDHEGLPLLAASLDPDVDWELVDAATLPSRLLTFAQETGIPFRVSPGVTGLDLIDETRPPRKDDDPLDPKFQTVRRWTPGDLPEFKRATNDRRVSLIEGNYSWWVPWDRVPEQAKQKRYAWAFDHNGHFLAPWRSTKVGVEGLVHRTGADATWDGSEDPGYYLVDRWDGVGDWRIPDPMNAIGSVMDEGRVLVTCHTLRQLAKIDPNLVDQLTVHESWTYEISTKYLSEAGKRLTDARHGADDPFVVETIKMIYAAATQKLAATEHDPRYHLWRPDWRDMIMGAARTSMLTTVQTIIGNGGHVLVVDRDTIIVASDADSADQAWPGDPDKFGRGPGQWKPTGVIELADWGPEALERRSAGSWPYTRHMAKMRQLEASPGVGADGEDVPQGEG